MSEVIGFMLLRFALIGGGIVLLILLLGVVVYALKKAGRYDQAKRLVEPVVRAKLGDRYEDGPKR
jgi:cbb3-type cytochrome oxidase subunit 3